MILVISVPPPYHGVTVANLALLDARFGNEFDCEWINTSDHRSLDNLGKLDLTNVKLALLHLGRLAYECLRRRPQVVYIPISQNSQAYLRDGLFIAVARVLGRAKVVTHLHGGRFLQFYEESIMPMKLFISLTQKLVHTAIVLGESLRVNLARWVDRIYVIPNGLDILLEEEPLIKMDSKAGLTVIFLSNLLKSKGAVDAVRSAKFVRDRFPESSLEFLVAGSWADDEPFKLSSGEIRAEIDAVLHVDQTDDIVSFLGPVIGEAKLDLLRKGDLLILPSYSEGQSTVILEAFAAGMPVVASAVGANSETVIDGVSGFLCRSGDPEDLANKICAIVEDDQLRARMSLAARARYIEYYTGGRFIARMTSTFRDIADVTNCEGQGCQAIKN